MYSPTVAGATGGRDPLALHDALESGKTVFGGWLSTALDAPLYAFQDAGFDFAVIDTQHAPISEEAVNRLIEPLRHTGFPIVVRVTSNDFGKIGRALDGGASGVIVPLVETATQAEAAVSAARFPPRGTRSFGTTRQDLGSLSREQLDRRSLVFVMIESAEGLANAAEIAAVPGLSGIFVGPADLSISLGLEPMAAFEGDQLVEQFATLLDVCDSAGVVLGAPGLTADAAKRWQRYGCRFISGANELQLLKEASESFLSELRVSSATF